MEAKSETVLSSDEEKQQQVDQGPDDSPRVPEHQNLLEVIRRRRYRLQS